MSLLVMTLHDELDEAFHMPCMLSRCAYKAASPLCT